MRDVIRYRALSRENISPNPQTAHASDFDKDYAMRLGEFARAPESDVTSYAYRSNNSKLLFETPAPKESKVYDSTLYLGCVGVNIVDAEGKQVYKRPNPIRRNEYVYETAAGSKRLKRFVTIKKPYQLGDVTAEDPCGVTWGPNHEEAIKALENTIGDMEKREKKRWLFVLIRGAFRSPDTSPETVFTCDPDSYSTAWHAMAGIIDCQLKKLYVAESQCTDLSKAKIVDGSQLKEALQSFASDLNLTISEDDLLTPDYESQDMKKFGIPPVCMLWSQAMAYQFVQEGEEKDSKAFHSRCRQRIYHFLEPDTNPPDTKPREKPPLHNNQALKKTLASTNLLSSSIPPRPVSSITVPSTSLLGKS